MKRIFKTLFWIEAVILLIAISCAVVAYYENHNFLVSLNTYHAVLWAAFIICACIVFCIGMAVESWD